MHCLSNLRKPNQMRSQLTAVHPSSFGCDASSACHMPSDSAHQHGPIKIQSGCPVRTPHLCRRYFAKVLAQSNAGKDPFEAPPPPRRERDVESILDPDLETVGAVLEGSRLFVLSALYIASQGASWVLLKVGSEGSPMRALVKTLRSPCWGIGL